MQSNALYCTGTEHEATTADRRRRLRDGLVVCEMALALVLLTGSGLLVRTFVQLANVDLGIDPKNVVPWDSVCPITSTGPCCRR